MEFHHIMQTLKSLDYSITFQDKAYRFLSELITDKSYSKIIVLSDTNTHEFCLPHFLGNLATEVAIEIVEIEPGEIVKNIATCLDVWNVLTDLGADRKSLLVNVGGGVITDLGGFVASTYKRGIDFVNVPTTLLSMVDASIGGKNGVDLGHLKNQIGTITTPVAVCVDVKFLETLDGREIRSGYAEMLKHGLIADANYWTELSNFTNLNLEDLERLIYRSIEIKNNIVSEDLTENGIRKALNFGHTLGHAIESYCLEHENFTTLLHGEAIAIGMILEAHLSFQKGLISKETYLEIKNVLLSIYEPVKFSLEDQKSICELMIHDKKNEYGRVQFVLLNAIGSIKINQEVTIDSISNAFLDYLE